MVTRKMKQSLAAALTAAAAIMALLNLLPDAEEPETALTEEVAE